MRARTHTHAHTHTSAQSPLYTHTHTHTHTSSEIPKIVCKKSTFKAWLRNLSKKPHKRGVKPPQKKKSALIQGRIFTRNCIPISNCKMSAHYVGKAELLLHQNNSECWYKGYEKTSHSHKLERMLSSS